MKLLIDHNLSPKLVQRLTDLFPDSTHVYTLELAEASDLEIWDYAQRHDFIIVTKDSDYNELLIFRRFPPKVIWIRHGNCSNSNIEAILRNHATNIQALINDPTLSLLTLY